MDRLPDDVLLAVFCHLDSPAAFATVSRRLYSFSRDPWTKARYLIARHGTVEALFHALGRGRLVDERTIDIMVFSGARLSRYLAQAAVQHVCRKAVHFVKGQWAKSLSFRVFTHLLHVTSKLYPDVDLAKGEDDGTLFLHWVHHHKSSSPYKAVSWDTMLEIFRNGFVPFCSRDPVYTHMPIAMALEPRLLPMARLNGLELDSKYRDFIFRKMFEKHFLARGDIADKVREITMLDDSMFIRRTIAAEVCMEACSNEAAYKALKALDRTNDLRFSLSDVAADLLSLFVRTRSVTQPTTIAVLHTLYEDFPAPRHPTVRLVMLLSIFCPPMEAGTTATTVKARLGAFDLLPLTRADIVRVLSSPFLENPGPLLSFARFTIAGFEDDEPGVVREAIHACLANNCKGKLLRALCELYPEIKGDVESAILSARIRLEDVPAWDDPDGGARAKTFHAPLCIGFGSGCIEHDIYRLFGSAAQDLDDSEEELSRSPTTAESLEDDVYVNMETDGQTHRPSAATGRALTSPGGHDESRLPVLAVDDDDDSSEITQETLSARISADERSFTSGSRRRWWSRSITTLDAINNKYPYPQDSLEVGKFVFTQFGAQHAATAVCLTHAIINGNVPLVRSIARLSAVRAPVTLEHFRILARLGRRPMEDLWQRVKNNAPFFYSANDYLDLPDVKTEQTDDSTDVADTTILGKRKRSTRTAGRAARSYAEEDSEEEPCTPTRRNLLHLETWIQHLTALHREEDMKWKERRRMAERDTNGKIKERVEKTEFLKDVTWRMKELRSSLAWPDHLFPTNLAELPEDVEYIPVRRKIARLG